ncbi:MAG: hypothetical protein KAH18_00105 [Psychromonas sp.]|nr:hypothetical protein [Psychromonas sp.]
MLEFFAEMKRSPNFQHTCYIALISITWRSLGDESLPECIFIVSNKLYHRWKINGF